MRVLLTVGSFTPEYGGPAWSVSQLGVALSRAGATVALWAPDGSAKTSSVIADDAPVTRLDGTIDAALAAASPDVVHDNGVWMPFHHAVAKRCAARGLRRVVSLRGMLEPWAFAYKPVRKRIAWLAYQRRDLAVADVIHATADSEAASFTRFRLPPPVRVIANGMDVPDHPIEKSRSADRTRVALFLSRVHPKKGLPMLVEAWAQLRPENWRLIIAGPEELGHAAEIRALAASRGLGDAVSLVGPQFGEDKRRLLQEADLFVLPTHSENFGMAVAEALADEIPVLTTTGAPWAELVSEDCGWWVSPTTEAIAAGLRDALSCSDERRAEMGARGRALIRNKYGWERIAQHMLSAYEGGTRTPGMNPVASA